MVLHSSLIGDKVCDIFPMPSGHSLCEERTVNCRRTVALCLHRLGTVIAKTILFFLNFMF